MVFQDFSQMRSQPWQLQLSNHLHRQKQMPRIVREGDKTVLLIKALRGLVDGIDFDGLNADYPPASDRFVSQSSTFLE